MLVHLLRQYNYIWNANCNHSHYLVKFKTSCKTHILSHSHIRELDGDGAGLTIQVLDGGTSSL